jgi:hypothetical protein
MTISIVGSTSELASSITTMPTHSAGNLLIGFGYNDGSSTAVTLPSGWIDRFFSAVGGAGYVRVGYKYAQSSSETSGTWTNADQLFMLSIAGGANTLVFPNYVSTNSTTTATINFAVQTAGTFQNGADDQALISWVASRNSGNTLTAPSGLTVEQSATDSTSFVSQVCFQASRTTAWASTNITVANSALYRSLMLSLVESPVYGISGGSGGLMLPNAFSGGYDG